MPHPSYYLDRYEYKYINDEDIGLSVYIFDNPDNGTDAVWSRPRAYHGSRVVVLAVRHMHSCILYRTEDNVLHAGWVSTENLEDDFPGDKYSVGKNAQAKGGTNYVSFMPGVKWSESPIADTRTKYTQVNNGGRKCVSMTIDYQVIGRNGTKAWGDRDVYCRVAGEWIKAGSFQVNENYDPVQFTIHFNAPVLVDAFLVIPRELYTQGFYFRQSVVEMWAEALDGESSDRSLPAGAAISLPQAEESSAVSYILNTNSMKFHLPSCPSVGNIKMQNKLDFYGTRDEAIAQGYQPCGRCHP